ncbi:hypothetical protein RUM44_008588 [Polyplax serrata]|uniref:Major facilitator superfamily (MFS) profile domain-containing protein n=1 Tax=Polyplax serrata TaxID=468196 RepID=A0ABR1BAT6_POLSC
MDETKKTSEADKTDGKVDKTVLTSKFGIRHLTVGLLFLGTLVGYASRVILSVTVVAMLKNETGFPSFDWDKQRVEGLVLSSFFWGYAAGQLPCGILIQHYGTRWPLLGAMTISSVCLLLLPVSAVTGDWMATCAIRVLQGFSQGALFPALYSAIAKWTPLQERGRLASIIFTGSHFGTIIAFPAAGFLITGPGGWPSVFYVFGSVGLAWCVLWYFLGYTSPPEHPFISKEEILYIEASLSNRSSDKLKTPWREIFTSIPIWALLVAQSAQNFGFWTLLGEIPTYFDAVMGFNMQNNGLLSTLPYLTMAGLCFTFGRMADLFFEKNLMSVVTSRKLFNTLGFWTPAVALAALGFVNKEQHTLGVVLLVVAVGFNAASYTGFGLVHMDLSPNFASIIMGLCNSASNVFSTVGTLLADSIIRADKTSTSNWQIVFSVTAATFFFGNVFFLLFGKVDRQPWNDADYNRQKWEDTRNSLPMLDKKV